LLCTSGCNDSKENLQVTLVNRACRLGKSEAGAALVEFAVILPILALLLTGVIDFGRYMYDGILAANAARAGAQYGAQTLFTAASDAGMENAALADAQNLPGLTATATHFTGTNGATYVQVNTTGSFTPWIHYPGLPTSVTVSGSAIMRVEAQ
jgi:Flp pilus assembly protein TadG